MFDGNSTKTLSTKGRLMNFDIFLSVSGLTEKGDTAFRLVKEESELARILTTHLLLERLLEGWICAHTGVDDLFKKPEKGSKLDRFSMTFSSKLAFCQRLGLPLEASKPISTINDFRNGFAHSIDYPGPDVNQVNSLMKNVDSFNPGKKAPSLFEDHYGVIICEGDYTASHLLCDEKTSAGLKVMLITFSLITRIISYIAINKKVSGGKKPQDYSIRYY
ncbi:hypothetical protein [Pantoea septica]|uniref:hypothetical protein n=1 Tax=Pantoea septica TaxID=472695 RepID=UPI0023F8649F|nr:hypothetical protein [Pantoea septica]